MDTKMSEITPGQLRQQIAHLSRCQADVAFRMCLAQLSGDVAEYSLLAAEYNRIEWTRDKLATELRALIALRREQAEAVAEAERILAIGY